MDVGAAVKFREKEFDVSDKRMIVMMLLCVGGLIASGASAADTAAADADALPLGRPDAEGYLSLFNGKDLDGWVGSVNGYAAEDGAIVCRKGGNLYTAAAYADFILRFEFQLSAGANNGLAIRAPLKGNAAYVGMELQVLDNTAEKYAKLRPYQFHGSIYGVVPAKRGHLKPVGEWNVQEVRAIGRKITVILNGVTIVDADLEAIGPVKGHPGLENKSGHIGFLGHGSRVAFRKLRIKPILPSYDAGPHNVPPEGFTALFNGTDLTGWRGRPHLSPKKSAEWDEATRKTKQAEFDKNMAAHWSVTDGVLVNDGGGAYLTTAKDYGDFELLVDYKMPARADSGIYLRGNPQVQIWDITKAGRKWGIGADRGSGGLWNNRKNSRWPLIPADQPFGQWNRFGIRIVGDKVTIHLNGLKIVDNVVMENFWDRKNPLPPTGPIQLQTHGGKISWRNIFIREIPPGEDARTPSAPPKAR